MLFVTEAVYWNGLQFDKLLELKIINNSNGMPLAGCCSVGNVDHSLKSTDLDSAKRKTRSSDHL